MADFIARLKVDSKEYDSKIDRARSGLLHLEESLKEAGKDFRQADQAQVKFVQDLGKMETVSRSARGQMNELKNAFTDLSVQYKRMSDLERQSPIGKAMAQSLGQLNGRIATLRTDLAGVEKQLGGMSGGGLGIGASIGGALKSFGPAALAAGGVMAAMNGLKSAMSDMVSINMQFEQSSANLAAVMGTTRDQTAALTAQAKQLGATTQYTAVQITELQTNLARLGFTESEILNSTKAVQALATATGAGLGDAANLAGAALRGFGMNAAEMERVASVLAVSTTKSALSFEKLAAAVPIVAPVAKQFGMTIEDTVTLLGKLSDAGFDASTAATSTRNIFLKMADSSGKLAQALGRPVRNVEDLGDALTELKNRGIDLAEMLELTDKRSVAAFATFIDNASTLKDFKASITDCSDALQGMVDEQLNTLQGSVTIMKSAWEGLMLTFSNSNGILKQTTDALTRLLTAWTNWRNRNAGGDAAIGSYEQGLTTEAKGQMDMLYKSYKAGGTTDQQIKAKADSATESLIKERDAVRDLYDQIVALNKATGGEYMTKLPVLEAQAQAMFPDRKAYDNNYIAKYIAGLNDKIAAQQYLAGLATPASVVTPAGGGVSVSAPAPKTTKADKGKWWGADMSKMFEVGSLADLEQQAAMVRESMKAATTPEEYKEMEAHLNEIIAKMKELKGEVDVTFTPGSLNDLNQQLKEAEAQLANLTVGTDEWAAALENVRQKQDAVNAARAAIQGQTSDVKDMKQAWGFAASAIGSVGSALQQIDDPTAKIAGIVAEAIANVAAGLGQMLAMPQSTAQSWGWIALAASGTATMISTIAAIKTATSAGKYAEGGVVGGNSYNGDKLMAWLNSGETVLNQNQAGRVLEGLRGSAVGIGNLELTTKVSGEDLMIILNNTNRARGGSRGYYSNVH